MALEVLLLHAASSRNRTLSYQNGWTRKFIEFPDLNCSAVNLAGNSLEVRLQEQFLRLKRSRFDVVILLHSVFSNVNYLYRQVAERVRKLNCPKVVFLGNEYKLVPEKMDMCEQLNVSLVVTQLPDRRAQELYKKRLNCRVFNSPGAGLDVDRFSPTMSVAERTVDIGYRAYESHWYLGHNERRRIAEFFQANGRKFGLTVDISLDPERRFDENDWAGFLNRCRGQIGSEAGGGFFEIDDATRKSVNAFVEGHTGVTFEDVFNRFFASYEDPVPGWVISGRHMEAAGTKTAQILFEGNYSGFFQPDVHFIPLKKDFSNCEEAVEKFKDTSFRQRIVENAYHLAVNELMYERLIERFVAELKFVV